MPEYRNPRGDPESYQMHSDRLRQELQTLRRAIRVLERYSPLYLGGREFDFYQDLQDGVVTLDRLREKIEGDYEATQVDEQERVEAAEAWS